MLLSTFRPLLLVVALLLSVACTADAPVAGNGVQVGRSLNIDGSIGNHATLFKPNETIYAALLTTGEGSAKVSARWTYNGQTVSEADKAVEFDEPMATEFRIQNALGFPEGDYAVEFFLDGVSAGSREFRVQR